MSRSDHEMCRGGEHPGSPSSCDAVSTRAHWQCPHCEHGFSFALGDVEVAKLAAGSHLLRRHGLQFVAGAFCHPAWCQCQMVGETGVETRPPPGTEARPPGRPPSAEARDEIERAILAARGTVVREIERDAPVEVGVPYNQWQCRHCGHWLRYGDEDRDFALSCAREHMAGEHSKPLTTASFASAEIRQLDRVR